MPYNVMIVKATAKTIEKVVVIVLFRTIERPKPKELLGQSGIITTWSTSAYCFSTAWEALENQSPVAVDPCANHNLQTPTGAVKGFSRASYEQSQEESGLDSVQRLQIGGFLSDRYVLKARSCGSC